MPRFRLEPPGDVIMHVTTEGSIIRSLTLTPLGEGGILAFPTVDLGALANLFVGANGTNGAPVKVAKPAPVKPTATKAAAAVKTAKPSTPKAAPTTDQPRAYRRRPAEFATVAGELEGSPQALAERFGVPIHTINGWLRRLESEAASAEGAIDG